MTEKNFGMPHLDPEKTDREKVTNLIRSLDDEILFPMAGDLLIREYAAGTKEETLARYEQQVLAGTRLAPSPLMDLFQETFAWHRNTGMRFTPVYAQQLLMRAAQKQAIRQFAPDIYPGIATKEWWRNFYQNNFDYIEAGEDLALLFNQANKPNRAQIVVLYSHYFEATHGRKPVVLVPGSSMGLDQVKASMVNKFPFNVNVVEPTTKYLGDEYEKVPALSDKYSSILNSKPSIQKSLGFDILPVNKADKNARLKVKAHSFFPSELLDEAKVAEHDALVNTDTDDVFIINESLDARRSEDVFRVKEFLPGRTADIIVLSHMLYYWSSRDRLRVLNNLQLVSNKDTRIIVVEHAAPDPTSSIGVKLFPQNKWKIPYSEHAIEMDPHNPMTAKTLARAKTNGWEEVWFSGDGAAYIESLAA